MFLTVEEMLELKSCYEKEARAIEAKIAVVDDMVAMAQSKSPVQPEVCETEETETEVVVQEETTSNYWYRG